MEPLIYLDTNVVLWLAGAPEQLSPCAKETIDTADYVLISPMVELEIEFLYEIGRLQASAPAVLSHLRGALDLRVCDRGSATVVETARQIRWTRDPFDRIITAQAAVADSKLLTRDKIIRANYRHASW